MPHVPPLSDDQIPADAKPITDAINNKLGSVLNIFRTLAHVPKVLEGVTTLDSGIQGDLPANLRELAYVRTSALNKCDY